MMFDPRLPTYLYYKKVYRNLGNRFRGVNSTIEIMVTYILKYLIFMNDRISIKYFFGIKHVRISNE
jgi:hypothetical protein